MRGDRIEGLVGSKGKGIYLQGECRVRKGASVIGGRSEGSN